MNIGGYKKKASLIRNTDVYHVYDLASLDHLSLSLTELKINKATSGHSHEHADEVYVFISGSGIIEIGKNKEKAKEGDVFLIPRGDFHRVYNRGRKPLKFWSIFEKYESRGMPPFPHYDH